MRARGGQTIRTGAGVLIVVLFGLRLAVVASDLPWAVKVVAADVLSFLIPMALVGAGAAYLAFRGRAQRTETRFWMLVASATVLELVSEAYWTWWVVSVDPIGPPTGAWSTYAALVASLLMFAILVTLSRAGTQPVWSRSLVYLDVLLAVAVLWPGVFLLWTGPLAWSVGGSAADGALLAVRTLVGLVVVVACFVLMGGWKSSRWRAWERLATVALLVFGAGMITSPVWFASLREAGRYEPSYFTDLLGLGFALMLLAIAARASSPVPMRAELVGRGEIRFSRAFLRWYPVAVAGALPIHVALALSEADEPTTMALWSAVAVLSLLLALRSWVVSVNRARVRRQAMFDPVSGALSGALLEERLQLAVGLAQAEGREVSVLVVGLYGLGSIADRFGFAESDEALRFATTALTTEAPRGCEVFRIASEDLAVIAPAVGVSDALAYARRAWLVMTRGSGPGAMAGIDPAIGVATYPARVVEPEDLLAAAEIARAAARIAEGDPIVAFEESVPVVSAGEHSDRVRTRNLRATVRTLAEAVDARDPATRDHSANVAELATALAQVLDLSDSRIQIVGLAALMHDIGKIGVRDEVLLKDTGLDAAERRAIEEHTTLGERILTPAGLDEIPRLVRWHHERWDGRGYPDGLSGHDIPIEARILAVCDAFETMTTGRTYRAALPVADALTEIEGMAGTQFDPVVAAAFVRMVSRLGPGSARFDLGVAQHPLEQA